MLAKQIVNVAIRKKPSKSDGVLRVVSYGPDALLVYFADEVSERAFDRGRRILSSLENHPPPGLVEMTPAFTSVLLEFRPNLPVKPARLVPDIISQLRELEEVASPSPKLHEIPVTYDGPDLDRVAQQAGVPPRKVIKLHSSATYTVFALGFSPGFPYLGPLDKKLRVPRLRTPRPRVKAGSVAIGGEHTGIYSVDSPGGWNVIGHTESVLFDIDKTGGGHREREAEAFLLRPGDRVRFVPTVKAPSGGKKDLAKKAKERTSRNSASETE